MKELCEDEQEPKQAVQVQRLPLVGYLQMSPQPITLFLHAYQRQDGDHRNHFSVKHEVDRSPQKKSLSHRFGSLSFNPEEVSPHHFRLPTHIHSRAAAAPACNETRPRRKAESLLYLGRAVRPQVYRSEVCNMREVYSWLGKLLGSPLGDRTQKSTGFLIPRFLENRDTP